MIRTLCSLAFVLAAFVAPLDAQSMPPGMHRYIFGLIRSAPDRPQLSPEEGARLQEGHLANIGRLARLGKIVLAGPFESRGEQRGLFIYDVASIEEAQALVDSDPLVKAGALVVDLTPFWATDGLIAMGQAWIDNNPEPGKAPPAPTMSNEQLAHVYIGLYMSGEIDALGEHLAWNAHFEDSVSNVTGRDDVLAEWTRVFSVITIESFETTQTLVAENQVLVTGNVVFTQAGSTPDSTLRYAMPMGIGLTLKGGKIERHVDYLDSAEFARQTAEQMKR